MVLYRYIGLYLCGLLAVPPPAQHIVARGQGGRDLDSARYRYR